MPIKILFNEKHIRDLSLLSLVLLIIFLFRQKGKYDTRRNNNSITKHGVSTMSTAITCTVSTMELKFLTGELVLVREELESLSLSNIPSGLRVHSVT